MANWSALRAEFEIIEEDANKEVTDEVMEDAVDEICEENKDHVEDLSQAPNAENKGESIDLLPVYG